MYVCLSTNDYEKEEEGPLQPLPPTSPTYIPSLFTYLPTLPTYLSIYLPTYLPYLPTSRSSFSVMSDSMKPGQTALTQIPREANSLALAL